MNKSPRLSRELFVEILQDSSLTSKDELAIFHTVYSLKSQEASATEIARILGWKSKNVVIGKIVGIGKRVIKKYGIKPTINENGTYTVFDIFFTGYFKGSFFIYQLRPELKEALIECGYNTEITSDETNNSFLFTWNPSKWPWDDLDQNIEEIKKSGKCLKRWSCISHKKAKPGDRAFLVKVGNQGRGIIGSGVILSYPTLGEYWGEEDKQVYYVTIEFEILLSSKDSEILSIENLKDGILNEQVWTPQSSGIVIKPSVINDLEEIWFDFLNSQNIQLNPYSNNYEGNRILLEGARTQTLQTKYERNTYARKLCLSAYGYRCQVCSMDFEEVYGNLGYQFIHVHHLTEISSQNGQYQVDPIKDLRPVCPNCHAMLHRKYPAFSIEELKAYMNKQ